MYLLVFNIIVILLVSTGSCQERSPKKGMVIPNWPRHLVGDFDNMDTISWWYNYLPVPEADYKNAWWCMKPGETPFTPDAKPQGEEREKCFPSDPNIEFIPMIFGGEQGLEDCGYEICGTDIPDEYQVILGFNEPNRPDQSDMSPQEAAKEWMKVMERYPDRILVSPATGNVDTDWFDQFWAECQLLGCRFDYLATHYYNAKSAQKTIDILRDYSDRYGGLKIWFTEFAVKCEHDEAEVIKYIEELLPLLEHSDFIYRYSWFLSRYYEEYDDSNQWFWLDPAVNSIKEYNTSTTKLTNIGKAYMKPYHLDVYKPASMK